MQRMSGVATQTAVYVDRLAGLHTRVLDTRKTTPGMRVLDKMAVKTGGGENHRMGLFDMILLKDNHIDFAGGIRKAIHGAREYLRAKGKDIPIECEVRSLEDIDEVFAAGGVDRIMFDNFTPAMTREAVKKVAGRCETESSGGITLDTVSQRPATFATACRVSSGVKLSNMMRSTPPAANTSSMSSSERTSHSIGMFLPFALR